MLLINPAREKFGGVMSRYACVGIPVAVGMIGAYLEWKGTDVRFVDEEFGELTPQGLDEYLAGMERPYIVGITTLTSQMERAWDLARMIKTRHPDAVVVFGGLHVTALPEESFERAPVDYVIRGEGEEASVSLVRAIRKGEDPRSIPGLSYRDEDGRVMHNPDATLIGDLNTIPFFPYEKFMNHRYDMGFIITSRGCPYKCNFCSQRIMTGLTYRYKSNERILEEMNLLINRYGQKSLYFYDDNFGVNRKRVKALCTSLIEAGFHKKCAFQCQMRADNADDDMFAAMRAANFDNVGFGIETASERLLEKVSKGETREKHMRALGLAQKHGFKITAMMIMGFPTETDEDRKTSFDFVMKNPIQFSKFNNLIPYPGTPVYEEVKHSDRLHISPGYRNLNSTLSLTRSIFDTEPLPYVPEGIEELELKKTIINYNLRFYFSVRTLKGLMRRDRGIAWIQLPPKWYLKPKEYGYVFQIGMVMTTNLLFSSLPRMITNPLWKLLRLHPDQVKLRSQEDLQARQAHAIQGKERKFVLSRA